MIIIKRGDLLSLPRTRRRENENKRTIYASDCFRTKTFYLSPFFICHILTPPACQQTGVPSLHPSQNSDKPQQLDKRIMFIGRNVPAEQRHTIRILFCLMLSAILLLTGALLIEAKLPLSLITQSLKQLGASNRSRNSTLDQRLSVDYLAKVQGFSVEAHKVVTKDDYILTIHRLVNPRASSDKENGTAANQGKVVILQHGILCASPFFLLNSSPNDTNAQKSGTSNSLAVALANLGYDVWLTNFRGTEHSREHRNSTWMEEDADYYWNFNVDTLVEYDLEAYVSYVLRLTKSDRYTFIGHSLGATVGLGSLLIHKETPVTNRLACSILMAPVASTQFIRGSLLPLFRMATRLYPALAPFPGASDNFTLFSRHLCLLAQRACTWLASMFIGAKQVDKLRQIEDSWPYGHEHTGRLTNSLARLFQAKSLFPRSLNGSKFESNSGSSTAARRQLQDKDEYKKQLDTFVLMTRQAVSVQILEHILQVHDSGRLSRFNYGTKLNKSKYGKKLAPIYDLNQVSEPNLKLALVSGASDAISTPEEIEWISRQVRNNVSHFEHIRIPVDPFNHMDLVMSRDAGQVVNRRVIDFIERNECFSSSMKQQTQL